MATVNLNMKNFEPTISAEGIVFVDWWAPWCGTCRVFGPVFEEASKRHPDIKFAKVDTQEEPSLAGAFNIRSIPTLMVFRDGVLIYGQPGIVPAQGLDELVKQARGLDMDAVRAEMAAEAGK